MAKRKINKTQLIKDYAAEHPDAKPKAIAEALTGQTGVKFDNRVVSQTLLMAKKAGKKARAKGIDGVSKTLLSAASLVKAAGGFENAKKALEILAKLKD
jgi:hypothetical protein